MYLYHVASRQFERDILRDGLIGHRLEPIWDHEGRPQPRGNYGYQYLRHALDFAKIVEKKPQYRGELEEGQRRYNIWCFETKGLEILYDPEVMLLVGEIPADEDCLNNCCGHPKYAHPRWYTQQTVCPSRLSLVSEQAIQECYKTDAIKTICNKSERMNPLPTWKYDG